MTGGGARITPTYLCQREPCTDLTAQHSDLVPQHQDLRVFGGVTPRQERQPAEHPDHEHADKADEHERRA